jgi:hypothetical protein
MASPKFCCGFEFSLELFYDISATIYLNCMKYFSMIITLEGKPKVYVA